MKQLLRFTMVLIALAAATAAGYAQDVAGTTAQEQPATYTLTAIDDAAADSLAAIPLGTRIYENKYVQMTYLGLPLIITGIATQGYVSHRFRDLRNAYTPNFHEPYDDYLQYAPAAAMLIVKACGVKGRSNWGRMITADAFSVAIMAAAVNSVKYTAKVMRPDASTANSFPSGHTATAFMAATMLHKEYGCVSPWISVGGYTVATAVGVSRILNNRHWISDVVAGAGIGILSVELGYFFADLIFKEKGLYHVTHPHFSIPYRPHNVGLDVGLTLPMGAMQVGELRLCPSTGSRAGVEGAWFGGKYWAVGGAATVSHTPLSLHGSDTEVHAIDAATFAVGGYGSYPVSRFRFTLSAMAGCNILNETTLIPDVLTADKAAFYYEVGAAVSVVARRNFGLKAFCDYGGYAMKLHVLPGDAQGPATASMHNTLLHTATVGVATSILF